MTEVWFTQKQLKEHIKTLVQAAKSAPESQVSQMVLK